ncbi:MAG TPA: HepT-like ribonuclease domain-containing protein, partial [Bryobacteraceae bacterium]|nr:HepT-like ribonuclease domain-containing protein [Bryobacteraceae bacterium]
MLERCDRITRFIAPGKQAFMESEALQDAVIRNVEVIGEAAKRVTAATRPRMPELDWKAICGMRDVLIHGYIGVDLDEVWNVACSRIPELQAALKQFLTNEPTGFADVP